MAKSLEIIEILHFGSNIPFRNVGTFHFGHVLKSKKCLDSQSDAGGIPFTC